MKKNKALEHNNFRPIKPRQTVERDFSLHCPLQRVRSLTTLTSRSHIPPLTPPLLQCWGPNSSLNCGAWKLTSEFFIIFFAYYFGRAEQQLRNLTSQQLTQKGDSKGEGFQPDSNMWLHLPRARGVVMTTSMLLGWWMIDSFYGVGRWTV